MSIELHAVGLKHPINLELFKLLLKRDLKRMPVRKSTMVTIVTIGTTGNQVLIFKTNSRSKGCIFTVHKDSVDSQTNMGRSAFDLGIQKRIIFMIAYELGGMVVNPQELECYSYDKNKNTWITEQLEPPQGGGRL